MYEALLKLSSLESNSLELKQPKHQTMQPQDFILQIL